MALAWFFAVVTQKCIFTDARVIFICHFVTVVFASVHTSIFASGGHVAIALIAMMTLPYIFTGTFVIITDSVLCTTAFFTWYHAEVDWHVAAFLVNTDGIVQVETYGAVVM